MMLREKILWVSLILAIIGCSTSRSPAASRSDQEILGIPEEASDIASVGNYCWTFRWNDRYFLLLKHFKQTGMTEIDFDPSLSFSSGREANQVPDYTIGNSGAINNWIPSDSYDVKYLGNGCYEFRWKGRDFLLTKQYEQLTVTQLRELDNGD